MSDAMFFIIFILGLIIGILILKYGYGFIKAPKYPKPLMSHLHQEVKDLMEATQQIKEDWSEVIGIMDQVRDRQSHLFGSIQTLTKNLCESRRQETGDKGGVLREEARQYVDIVDALAAKLVNLRQTVGKQVEAPPVDESSQEEVESSHSSQTTIVADEEPVKDAIAVVKKVLKDFLKENRKNINLEKEEMKKNVRGMTDGLKESIVSSFTVVITSETDHQQQLTITTEEQDSVRELSTKMLGVEKSLKRAAIDVSSTKGILDTIDGQLDEIYGKLELDKKAIGKQCRESSAKMAAILDDVDKQAGVLDETGAALAKVIAGMPREEDNVQKKVEEVSEVVHRFAARVEVPMKMLVCNMRFLYQSTLCRSKNKEEKDYERGDVPDGKAQGVKAVEGNVRSFVKDLRMRARSRKGSATPPLDFLLGQVPRSMRQSVSLGVRGKAIPLKSS